MTATEKWNIIVEHHSKNISVSEDTVQIIWEKIFAEIFGYSSLAGEIESQRTIRIGSTERMTADIVIKNNVADLFVVELKKHNLPFDKGMEMQLFSYLKQLRNNTGILICDKIYIYAYDYNKSDSEQNRTEIEFKRENPDGIKFIDMFSKATFEEQAVKQFVHQKIESAKNIEFIKKEVNSTLVTKLLRDYFTSKYSEAEFEQAMNDFDIAIVPRMTMLDKPVVDSAPSPGYKTNKIAQVTLCDKDNLYYRFWEKALPVLREKTGVYKNVSPSKYGWLAGASGHSGVIFSAVARKGSAKAEVFIRTGDKMVFRKLESKKAEIEESFGDGLYWRDTTESETSSIGVKFDRYGLVNEEHWDVIINFLADNLAKLITVFKPILDAMKK